MSYNGWSNYETWNVNLWIDNDWQLSETITLHTLDLFGSYEDVDKITSLVASYIADLFLELAPDLNGFFLDIVNSALREVNWYEIASHYVDNEVQAKANEQE